MDELNINEILERMYYAKGDEKAVFVITDYDGTERSRKKIGTIMYKMIEEEGVIPVFSYHFLPECELYDRDKEEYSYYQQKALQLMSVMLYRMQCEEIRVYGCLSEENEQIFDVLAINCRVLNVFDEQFNRIEYEKVEMADRIPEEYWKLHDIYQGRQWDFECEIAYHEDQQQYYEMLDHLLGECVDVVIERPLGSQHPRYSSSVYELNYGYVCGVKTHENRLQKAYVLGVDSPIEKFNGRVVAVIHRKNDVEDKLVVAPCGMEISPEFIKNSVHFMEQYFESEIKCIEVFGENGVDKMTSLV